MAATNHASDGLGELMTQTRFYSDTAVTTTLSADISDTAVSLTVAATTGLPSSFPYTLAIDTGTENEELVDVTAASGTTLTVTRAYGGTGALAHSAGAAVDHVFTGADATAANAHAGASQSVHGLTSGSEVVGTEDEQTLAHKTLDTPTIGNFSSAQHTHASGTQGGTVAHSALTGLTSGNPHTQYALGTDLSAHVADFDAFAATAGEADGLATLDSGGLVPYAELPVGTASGSTVADGGHTHSLATDTVTVPGPSLTFSASVGYPATLSFTADEAGEQFLFFAQIEGVRSTTNGSSVRVSFDIISASGTGTYLSPNATASTDRNTYDNGCCVWGLVTAIEAGAAAAKVRASYQAGSVNAVVGSVTLMYVKLRG